MWRKLARFFERGDLVPFAVITSIWHFVGVLVGSGEFYLVAVAQGVLVDMLHYRTVIFAVRRRDRVAWLIALLTTGISFGFHYLFYDSAAGWERLLYAAPLPLGIPILAWQAEQTLVPAVVVRWRKRARLIVRLAKGWRKRAQAAEKLLQDAESRAQAAESRAQAAESKWKEADRAVKVWKGQAEQAEKRVQALGPLGQDMVRVIAGDVTGREVAEKHGLSEAKISRLRSDLNGST